MADVGVEYFLDTPSVDITFNDGIEPFDGTDKYYITEIRGLESPDLRTPMDPVPLGYGALIHPAWFGARHIGVEGVIIVSSTTIRDDVVKIRNEMTEDLTSALEGIIAPTNGTLTFDPQGAVASISYTVNYEIGLNTTHTDNYYTLQFSFGLVAGNPFG